MDLQQNGRDLFKGWNDNIFGQFATFSDKLEHFCNTIHTYWHPTVRLQNGFCCVERAVQVGIPPVHFNVAQESTSLTESEYQPVIFIPSKVSNDL